MVAGAKRVPLDGVSLCRSIVVDGRSVDELPAYLKEHWPATRAQLLDGTYKPQPVRRVEIPKASGGVRLLGIPTWTS